MLYSIANTNFTRPQSLELLLPLDFMVSRERARRQQSPPAGEEGDRGEEGPEELGGVEEEGMR